MGWNTRLGMDRLFLKRSRGREGFWGWLIPEAMKVGTVVGIFGGLMVGPNEGPCADCAWSSSDASPHTSLRSSLLLRDLLRRRLELRMSDRLWDQDTGKVYR